jgi:ribosomal protein L13E
MVAFAEVSFTPSSHGFRGIVLREPFWKDEHPMFGKSRRKRESETLIDDASLKTEGVLSGGPAPTMIAMTTWQKRDWQQFYELARRPWRRHRPPRPVYPSGLNRVAPAQGYSLSELDDAGVDLDLAERLGLPVDAGRIGVYGPNVTVLREFVRSNRHPL